MAVFKRITAGVGNSHVGGGRTASEGGAVCPHCHSQTRYVPLGGKTVCQLCGKEADA